MLATRVTGVMLDVVVPAVLFLFVHQYQPATTSKITSNTSSNGVTVRRGLRSMGISAMENLQKGHYFQHRCMPLMQPPFPNPSGLAHWWTLDLSVANIDWV